MMLPFPAMVSQHKKLLPKLIAKVIYLLKVCFSFSDDIKLMLGAEPGWYWRITWCFLSPLCMGVLFIASIINLAIKTPQYKVYDRVKGKL